MLYSRRTTRVRPPRSPPCPARRAPKSGRAVWAAFGRDEELCARVESSPLSISYARAAATSARPATAFAFAEDQKAAGPPLAAGARRPGRLGLAPGQHQGEGGGERRRGRGPAQRVEPAPVDPLAHDPRV